MMSTRFLTGFLFLALSGFTQHLSAAEKATRAPNIVLIVADDLGYGDIGPYGQQQIATPHLDQLAKRGVTFTSAYAGSPVCAPSRCVLMTGLHTGHARIRGNGGQLTRRTPEAVALQATDHTIAKLLKKAGYTTALVGKWGLGDAGAFESGLPRKQGFDYFFGYLSQSHAHNSYPSFLWRNEERIRLPNIVPDEAPNGTGVSSNRAVFAQDLFIDEALNFIREQKSGPFFLCFTTTLPHANNESKPIGLEVPSLGEYADRDWPLPQKLFAAMVTRLDTDVGRVVGLLKELGIEDDTLILFVSDNGPHREGGQDPEFFQSSGPLRGIKRALYDGGIRVPAIASWPGRLDGGVRNDTPWYFADVMPTFAAIAGVEAPASDGANVWSAFLGKPDPALEDRPLYWEFYEGGFCQAARRGKWKAVRPSVGAPLELFDLSTDIGERNNVAWANPELTAYFEQFINEQHVDSPHWVIRAKGENAKPAGAGKAAN
jgi:Arylsulfatase A and related enzymes